MPKRDVNRYLVSLKRMIGLICFIDTTYLFLAIMFWQKSDLHPIYCGLCEYFHMGTWIGLIIDFHCIFIIIWCMNLIHAFVTRRYYLLAIGGFEN